MRKLALPSALVAFVLLAPGAAAEEYRFAASDLTRCLADASHSATLQPDGNWTVSADVELDCNQRVHHANVRAWLSRPEDPAGEYWSIANGNNGCNLDWDGWCEEFPFAADFTATDLPPGTYELRTGVGIDLRAGPGAVIAESQGGPGAAVWVLMPAAEHDRDYDRDDCLPTGPYVPQPINVPEPDYAQCTFVDELVLE